MRWRTYRKTTKTHTKPHPRKHTGERKSKATAQPTPTLLHCRHTHTHTHTHTHLHTPTQTTHSTNKKKHTHTQQRSKTLSPWKGRKKKVWRYRALRSAQEQKKERAASRKRPGNFKYIEKEKLVVLESRIKTPNLRIVGRPYRKQHNLILNKINIK